MLALFLQARGARERQQVPQVEGSGTHEVCLRRLQRHERRADDADGRKSSETPTEARLPKVSARNDLCSAQIVSHRENARGTRSTCSLSIQALQDGARAKRGRVGRALVGVGAEAGLDGAGAAELDETV